MARSATSSAPTEDDAMAAYLIADVDIIDAGMASLTAWYDSPEYAPLKALRKTCARTRSIAMEGVAI
jgi:uncharacterized protein (DUF1330 family)